MSVSICASAALVVSAIYYGWRDHRNVQLTKLRSRRERVAYLLWASALGRLDADHDDEVEV